MRVSTAKGRFLRVAAYIDGYNLYRGLLDKYDRRYLWLDLEALVKNLLKPYQSLASVTYFTAPTRNNPPRLQRQQTYWSALEIATSIRIVKGRFQEKQGNCWSCSRTWRTYEEKETDVSLAVSLVEDAVEDRYDAAMLISGDSDLCPALRSVKRLKPQKRLITAFPPARVSDDLRKTADANFSIGRGKIEQSMLPDVIQGPNTTMIKRPSTWY